MTPNLRKTWLTTFPLLAGIILCPPIVGADENHYYYPRAPRAYYDNDFDKEHWKKREERRHEDWKKGREHEREYWKKAKEHRREARKKDEERAREYWQKEREWRREAQQKAHERERDAWAHRRYEAD